MATSPSSAAIPRLTIRRSATVFRQPQASTSFFLPPPKHTRKTKNLLPLKFTDQKKTNLKWVLFRIRSSVESITPKPTTFNAQQLVDFLYEDLPHLFDDRGIDRTAYDERVKFRDPITKHDTVSGYLFNIAMLKNIFTPNFQLHWVKQVCCFSKSLSLSLYEYFWILLC